VSVVTHRHRFPLGLESWSREHIRLASHEPQLVPCAGAKRACRRKEILLNGAKCRSDTMVQSGDKLEILARVGAGQQWQSFADKPGLDVAYEDEHLACIVKPQGLRTQGKGVQTVQGRIKYCLQQTTLPGALFRPHQVLSVAHCTSASNCMYLGSRQTVRCSCWSCLASLRQLMAHMCCFKGRATRTGANKLSIASTGRMQSMKRSLRPPRGKEIPCSALTSYRC
jgi:hypothetical protein